MRLVSDSSSDCVRPNRHRRPGSCVIRGAVLKPLDGEPLLHDGRQPAAGLLHPGVLQQPPSLTEQLFIARPAGPSSQYVPQPEARAQPEQPHNDLLSCKGRSGAGLPGTAAGLAAELHIQLDGQVGALQGLSQVSQCFGLDLLA